MITSFKCYVDHSHTMYSSGNIDVRNWVYLFKSPCIRQWYGGTNVQQLSNIRNVTVVELITKIMALLAAYVGEQKFRSTCSCFPWSRN